MRIVSLTKETTRDILDNLLKRSPNNYGKYESAVAEILANVKTKGDEALFSYTEKFDHCVLSPDTIQVTREEIDEAYTKLDEEFIRVMRQSAENIRVYHEKQRQYGLFDTTPD